LPSFLSRKLARGFRLQKQILKTSIQEISRDIIRTQEILLLWINFYQFFIDRVWWAYYNTSCSGLSGGAFQLFKRILS
jgi:hypothetical protein